MLTVIPYHLNSARHLNVSIFDVFGQKIKEHVNDLQSSGYYEVEFDGKDYCPGIYYCVLSTGDEIITRTA